MQKSICWEEAAIDISSLDYERFDAIYVAYTRLTVLTVLAVSVIISRADH